jgi:hypothetical protein
MTFVILLISMIYGTSGIIVWSAYDEFPPQSTRDVAALIAAPNAPLKLTATEEGHPQDAALPDQDSDESTQRASALRQAEPASAASQAAVALNPGPDAPPEPSLATPDVALRQQRVEPLQPVAPAGASIEATTQAPLRRLPATPEGTASEPVRAPVSATVAPAPEQNSDPAEGPASAREEVNLEAAIDRSPRSTLGQATDPPKLPPAATVAQTSSAALAEPAPSMPASSASAAIPSEFGVSATAGRNTSAPPEPSLKPLDAIAALASADPTTSPVGSVGPEASARTDPPTPTLKPAADPATVASVELATSFARSETLPEAFQAFWSSLRRLFAATSPPVLLAASDNGSDRRPGDGFARTGVAAPDPRAGDRGGRATDGAHAPAGAAPSGSSTAGDTNASDAGGGSASSTPSNASPSAGSSGKSANDSGSSTGGNGGGGGNGGAAGGHGNGGGGRGGSDHGGGGRGGGKGHK